MLIKQLTDIKKDETAKLVNIVTDEENKSQLYSIGFTPGTKIQVLEVSPFSGPISFKVRGTKIALRHKQAESIFVI